MKSAFSISEGECLHLDIQWQGWWILPSELRVRMEVFCADTVVVFQLQADRRGKLSSVQDLLL